MPFGDVIAAMDDTVDLRPLLKPAQEHVLTTLAARDEPFFARVDYEAIAHVSRSQAAYDLADLVKLGLVERIGSGRGTRYRIVPAKGGRRRKWTPERIRTELEELCERLGRWPKASDFREAGRGDLYVAASRYGGIEHWMDELGLQERRGHVTLAGVGRWVRVVAAATVAALGLGLIAGSRMPDDPSRLATRAAPPPGVTAGALPRPAPEAPAAASRPAAPTGVELRLAARGGASWLAVRRNSAKGAIVWKGLLGGGRSVRLRGGRLWIRIGAPGNLAARLNGERVALPPRTSTVVARASGLRVLEVAPPPEPIVLVEAPTGPPAPVTSVPAGASSSPAAPAPALGGTPAPDPQPGSKGGPSPDPRP